MLPVQSAKSADGTGDGAGLGIIPSWLERSLCVLVILLKTAHFWRFRGVLIGYDIGDHLQRYQQTDWWMPEPPLHNFFYAYHPPLGFLVPHLFARLGLDGLVAMQLCNTLCGIAAFLFLRAVLGRLQCLSQLAAFGFLYLWAGIPILINCEVSLNLDIMILAAALAILYCAVRLWGVESTGAARKFFATALVLIFSAALLTKFSALLLLALPFGVVCAFRPPCLGRSFLACAALVVVALACVFPYYHQRYYLTEKTYLPRNQDYWIPEELQAARQLRDQDRGTFFAHLLAPKWLQPPRDIETRDKTVLRYSDVWRDFWIRDADLYYQPGEKIPRRQIVIRLGIFYGWLMAVLALAGGFIWSRTPKKEAFDRLGWVFLAQGAIFVAAHLAYCYQDALASYGTTKGIYVLPVTLVVAFLAVQPLRKLRQPIWLILLPLWLLVNYLWPVY